MNYHVLKKVVERFEEFEYINSIRRVDDNILKIEFNRDDVYFLDLKRGASSIFTQKDFVSSKVYQAPFDLNLKKLFSKAKIESICVLENDRIIRFEVTSSLKYKSTKTYLQVEFTGKNTNAIILNDQNIIIEALRHIDIRNSFREVKAGKRLLDLPKREIRDKPIDIDDIDSFLVEKREEIEREELERKKSQAVSNILKRQKSLLVSLQNLSSEERLFEISKVAKNEADLILANLNSIDFYKKEQMVVGFDGEEIKVEIPSHARDLKEASKILYERSKKAKQKAKNLHIEKENLEDKILFLNRLIGALKATKTIDELNLYTQKREKRRAKKSSGDELISFFIDGYKVSVGRNQKENMKILKIAKSDDIWMHIKDRASSHVIIHTGKQKIEESILYNAAKMCVNFSGCEGGRFSVDYTRRKFVKIQDGANVLYTHDKTIIVLKE